MKTFKLLNNNKDAKSIVDIFLENPSRYHGALGLAQQILREKSTLSEADRELIAAYTSRLNKCNYCYKSHLEFAKQCGADQSDIDAVDSGNIHSVRIRPLLEYAYKLTLSPDLVNYEDVDNVLNNGFSKEDLKSTIAVCAIFNFFNRIVEGHGVIYSEDDFAISAERISKNGYDGRYA